ncbi:MAG: GspH/FimT family protein [Desulfobacterales bacterium]|nr:GspH/FimT family protein [Desulfobacterales bacterium]
MAIIAIMGLFMAPAIGEWMDNYRIRQAARDIASTLQLAKMQAISTRTPCSVTFDTINNAYQIQGGSLIQTPRGVSIPNTDFDATGDAVRFNPNGTASSPALTASIYINNTNGKQYRVRVSPSGNISMQEGWT